MGFSKNTQHSSKTISVGPAAELWTFFTTFSMRWKMYMSVVPTMRLEFIKVSISKDCQLPIDR